MRCRFAQERLRNYEKAYETLSDTEGDYSYIKVIDVGKKVCAMEMRRSVYNTSMDSLVAMVP